MQDCQRGLEVGGGNIDVGTRRKARIVALQALFESDCSHHDAEASLNRLAEEQSLPASGLSFARELVRGVLENKPRIDSLIRVHAPSWPVEQLSVIDRNILRLAIFEISINNKVPVKAAINEAVELAKLFGGESSPKFVNGVLGAISQARVSSK
jgi:N utilization substance protein B